MAKQATALGVKEAAARVLAEAGEPLHVRDITDRVLAIPGVKLKGKTPRQTVAARLMVAAKNGDRFVRTAPNTFGLIS